MSEPQPFTPAVPRQRQRHNGWTPERQAAFIEALRESGCVTEAAAAVGMSPSSAYRLRTAADARDFCEAWDEALDFAIRRIADGAFSRALHGTVTPVFYKGEQIGERRHWHEGLVVFLLRDRDRPNHLRMTPSTPPPRRASLQEIEDLIMSRLDAIEKRSKRDAATSAGSASRSDGS